MKILVDIGHPAHFHLFKFFAVELQAKGHHVLFTCREKEFVIHFLKSSGFPFVTLGKKFNSYFGKILGLLFFGVKVVIIAFKFKPDIFISHGSIYTALASWILGKPHISMEDTYNQEQVRLYLPFTKYVLTSNYEHPLKTQKLIKYAGYHELAYLHPKRFTPNKQILDELDLKQNEKYVIIRFVSLNASHDIGHRGISVVNKLIAINSFVEYAKVFISSEEKLPNELVKYKIPVSPEKMHDAMAFASLIFGESSTMSEEAAMLGVPSVFVHKNNTHYTYHLEHDHGLLFNFGENQDDQIKAIEKGIELLKTVNVKEQWSIKRNKMLSTKIDVTSFMVWFIENYPNSVAIMKDNPDYQYNFK